MNIFKIIKNLGKKIIDLIYQNIDLFIKTFYYRKIGKENKFFWLGPFFLSFANLSHRKKVTDNYLFIKEYHTTIKYHGTQLKQFLIFLWKNFVLILIEKRAPLLEVRLP
ncbi:MAG: hypothetical protein GY928_00005 [Colwellia sp.]|nr:hypothetical protein [Colwellia sp.]